MTISYKAHLEIDLSILEPKLKPHYMFQTSSDHSRLFKGMDGLYYAVIVAKKEMNGRVPYCYVQVTGNFAETVKNINKALEELRNVARGSAQVNKGT